MFTSHLRLKLALLVAALLTVPAAALAARPMGRPGGMMMRPAVRPMGRPGGMMMRPAVRPAVTPANMMRPTMTPMHHMNPFFHHRPGFRRDHDFRRDALTNAALRAAFGGGFPLGSGGGFPFGSGGGGGGGFPLGSGGGFSVLSEPAAAPPATPDADTGQQNSSRRSVFDEWKAPRAVTASYEDHRQAALQERFRQALDNPPNSAIRSGVSLNDLVTIIRETETATGSRGPTQPLSRDAVEHINWTTGSSALGVAMVKNGSKELRWPDTLMQARFGPQRAEVGRLVDEAVAHARDHSPSTPRIASEIADRIDAIRDDLRDPKDYLEAAGFLRQLGDAVVGLKDPGAYRLLGEGIRAATVNDLVDYMTTSGLQIGAAAPGDESYYTALYDALSTFERGLARSAGFDARPGNAVSSAGR